MLMRFFNPSDFIGCGGDINQSDSFRYTEGVRGGGTQRGMRRGYAEGVHGGGTWRGYAEGVHGGGTQRGTRKGMRRGYMEGVCGGVHGGGYEGYFVGIVGPSGEFYRCTIILGYFQISAKVITNVKAPFPGVEQFIHTNITQVW